MENEDQAVEPRANTENESPTALNSESQITLSQKNLQLNLEETELPKVETELPNVEPDKKRSFAELNDIYQQTSARMDLKKPRNFLRMSTVSLSSRKVPTGTVKPSKFTEEPTTRRAKTPPGPSHYTPRMTLTKLSAPSFPIAERDKLHSGGGRTSWEMNIFASPHDASRRKTRFDDCNWPAPCQFSDKDTLYIGKVSAVSKTSPAYSMLGVNREKSLLVNRDAYDSPASIDYDRGSSDAQVLKKGPAFKMGVREKTVLWNMPENTPAPGTYLPKTRLVKNHFPSFTFAVKRFEKRMDQVVGPITYAH